MSVEKPTISTSLRKCIIIVALLGYIAMLFYLFYFVGIEELISVIKEVNLTIYALALSSVLISLIFHTLVWFQLLKSLSIKISFRKTHVLYWVGVFIDNLIPGGWSGDLFKAYLLNKDPKVQSGKAVASVVAKNLYETIFNLGSMGLGLILLLLNYTLEGSLLIALGGIMLLLTTPLIILLIASFRPKSAEKVIDTTFNVFNKATRKCFKLSELKSKVKKGFGNYHEGMRILLGNRRVLLNPVLFSFIAWGLEIITLLLVFTSLGAIISPDKVIIVRSVAGNVEAQGFAFAGYAQILTTTLYTVIGVNLGIAASAALLGGVIVFWLKTGISYIAFHITVFSKPLDTENRKERSKATQNS